MVFNSPYCVTEVWPGIFVGSAMMADAKQWREDNNVPLIYIASRTAYKACGWAGVPSAMQLYFNDAEQGLSMGQAMRILKTISHVHADQRVAFLCQGGLNRSSFMACLYRWWTTTDSMAKIIRELTDARVKVGVVDVLCNRAFVAQLHSFDQSLRG